MANDPWVLRCIEQWDDTNPAKSLRELYAAAVANAVGLIRWYERNRWYKRLASKGIRASAITLGAAGALCPLIDAALSRAAQDAFSFSVWGYVSIAVAASLLAYDKFFGLSSGWIRFIVTQMAVERALLSLQYDWARMLLLADSPPTKPQMAEMLQRLQRFGKTLGELVEEETRAWANEFQQSLADLAKQLKMEAEATRLGTIRVVVSNATEFDTISVALDGLTVRVIEGATETECTVPAEPGLHQVAVLAMHGEARFKSQKSVELRPGATEAVTLTLVAASLIEEPSF